MVRWDPSSRAARWRLGLPDPAGLSVDRSHCDGVGTYGARLKPSKERSHDDEVRGRSEEASAGNRAWYVWRARGRLCGGGVCGGGTGCWIGRKCWEGPQALQGHDSDGHEADTGLR